MSFLVPKRTWKVWLRDGAIGFGLSLLFLYWTFPWDAVKQRLEIELSQSLSSPQAPAQVAVGDLHSSWFTGVVLDRVLLSRPDPTGGPPRSVLLPEIRLRVSPFAFLRGITSVSFAAKLFGGQIEGQLTDSKKLSALELDASGLQLAQTKDLLAFFGGAPGGAAGGGEGPLIDPGSVDLAGLATAKIDLSFKPNDFASMKGMLTLGIDHAVIGGGLPTTDLGNIDLKTHFQEGKLDVERFEIGGEDVKGETDGVFLTLNQNLGFSMLHGKAKVKFGDEYQKKIPVGSIITLTFNKQPDRDGYFVLPLGGTLKSPKIL